MADFDIQEFLATDFFLKVQNTTSPLEVFRVLSESHHGMPLFPFTFFAHCILVALNLRSNQGEKPLSGTIGSILMLFLLQILLFNASSYLF